MTADKEVLQKFIDICEDLEKRGYSEDGIAYAVGFNNTAAYRAFRAIVEKNLEIILEKELENG